MPVKVYKIKSEDSQKANQVTREDAFARNGYILRDSQSLGIDGDEKYLYIEGPENFFEEQEEKLTDFEELEGSDKKEIQELFEKDEENVASGVGSIFG